MAATWYKSLKLFDPKTDLQVDETFRIQGQSSELDTLGELEQGAAIEEKPTNRGKIKLRVKTPSALLAGPLLWGERLLCAGRNGHISLFNIRGDELTPAGQLTIGGEILKTPALSEHMAYVTTREGKIVALNLDEMAAGSEKAALAWQKSLPKSILAEPVISGNSLIVASLAGIYAFDSWHNPADKDQGRQLWLQQHNGVACSPAVSGGNLYVGNEDKVMTAFQFGGGEISERWRFPVKQAIRTRPCISEKNDYLLFASMDGSLYCLDRHEGIQRWYVFLNAPVYSTPVIHSAGNMELYLLGADNGYFYCFDTYGRRAWTFRTGGKIRTEALVHEGIVYFGSGDNSLYALDIASGRLVFKTQTDGPIAGKPVLHGKTLYFGSADSFIYGVDIE